MKFKVSELIHDPSVYPRHSKTGGVWWQLSLKYAENMKAGHKFPPIIVGTITDASDPRYGAKIIVDGVHRWEAHKINKEAFIEGDTLKEYANYQELYEDAFELNSKHGQSLPYRDKVRGLFLFQKWGYPTIRIEELTGIPRNKFDDALKRVVEDPETGEVKYLQSITAKALAAEQITNAQALKVNQKRLAARTAQSLANQLIDVIEQDLWPEDESSMNLLKQLYATISKYLI